MQEAKSEMSVLDEDAKIIDTPLPQSSPFTPLLGEAPLLPFRLLPVQIFFLFPHLPPPLNTKGGCPGSGGVVLLKCEGLPGAAPGTDLC